MDEIKRRQSLVSQWGRVEEYKVVEILLSDDEIKNNCEIGSPHKVLTSEERKLLQIDYRIGKEEIDADLVVLERSSRKILCVISVKKSFRERGAQTAYWAVKVRNDPEKEYKYILVTPDVDKELYNENNPFKRRKWRVILPYECDAVFVVSYEGKVFEDDNFYVGKDYLIKYVKKLLKHP
ncbi:MAG: BsaWI family type II restriction enzyme [Nitrososphaeria archaeon]